MGFFVFFGCFRDFFLLAAILCIQWKPPLQRCLIEAADRRQGQKYLQLSEIADTIVVVFVVAVVTIVIGVACLDNDTAGVAERGSRGGARAEETRL